MWRTTGQAIHIAVATPNGAKSSHEACSLADQDHHADDMSTDATDPADRIASALARKARAEDAQANSQLSSNTPWRVLLRDVEEAS
jgi:hypothetical protein